MSRLFLTNIDLNTNELQNAVIQNLSSAPSSGNKEGRIYYDNTTHKLRVYRNDALQGAKWYDLSVGGAAASTVTLTGDVVGSASVDPATGIITLATTLNVSGTTNQIKVNDINHVTTISLTDIVNINTGLEIGGTNTEANGYIRLVNSSGTLFGYLGESNDGNLLLKDSNTGVIETGENEIQVKETSYWASGTRQGFVNAETNGKLLVNATTGDLELQSDSGSVVINPYTGSTIFNNNLSINNNGKIDTATGSLKLNANNGVITTQNAELHTTKAEFWLGGDEVGTNLGAVIAHPSDGSLTVAATGWLHLESHSGGINLDPSNGQTTFSDEIRLDSTGTISTNNTDLTLSPDSGNVVINNNLVTDSIVSKNAGTDELTVNANTIVLQTTNTTIGGAGTNGSLTIKNSSSDDVLTVVGSTKLATFAGDVSINGNLNVKGTLTAINKQEIDISDNTIVLNSNFTTGTPSQDAAITVKRGSANDVNIIWSEGNKDWTLTNDGNNYFAIARKAVFTVGDTSNTSFDVVHNLGTRDLTVQVRENNAEYNLVETDIAFKDANTVTVSFTNAPDTNAYKVVIVG
jgi:hypothetical protein